MKMTSLLAPAAVLALIPASLQAAFTVGDPNVGGIGYYGYVAMGYDDTAQFSTHVGAWSWEDNALFDASSGEPPVGWTHTSRWIGFELLNETLVTLTVVRDSNVDWIDLNSIGGKADTSSMFPSFTLFQNWDNDDGDSHRYNNRGNVSWAEDLVYRGHVDNSTQTSISQSYHLPAGQYTFVIGSNAPANNTLRQGFSATFSTAPEPTRALLLGMGWLGFVMRRRR